MIEISSLKNKKCISKRFGWHPLVITNLQNNNFLKKCLWSTPKLFISNHPQNYVNTSTNLLLIREPNTIRLSSRKPTISDVSAPLRRSSPRDLNGAKESDWAFQSVTTCVSLASMSFSLTAEIHMSWKRNSLRFIHSLHWHSVIRNFHIKLILKFHKKKNSSSKTTDLDILFVFQKGCFHNIT